MSAAMPQEAIVLPALRQDAKGCPAVDWRAILWLALPLFLNSGIQAILNLTDTWFLGRLSAGATAAVGSVYWFVVVVNLLLGGVAMAVQTLVAQAVGAGQPSRAAAYAWTGLWAASALAPAFFAAAWWGPWLLPFFNLPTELRSLATEFWFPRVLGGMAGVALWVVSSFFNGVGRTGVTLGLMAAVAGANALLNEWFIFGLHLGIAGSGWATTAAQVLGLALALGVFLGAPLQARYATRRNVRTSWASLRQVLLLGLPMGLAPAVDLTGLALFQVMQAGLGTVAGAATQIAMMLTSVAYMPAVGIAIAGTTLVGQSIGAGNPAWALRLGNRIIALAALYMGLVGVLLALAGPWLPGLFLSGVDPDAPAVAALARQLLWFAAAYQLFDGINLGSAFCLRGAGDVRVPTLLLLGLSWLGFVPIAHMLTFAPGQGFVPWLPHLGFGVLGGWTAALGYTLLLGSTLYLRWRSRAWERIRLPPPRRA